jgi:hypothetical protein
MTAELGLIERLQAASAAALADIGPTLEHDSARLRGVMLELEVGPDGRVLEATAWVERRARVGVPR